jgi:hypothetical protein
MKRKLFVATIAASTLSACSTDAKNQLTNTFRNQLGLAQKLNQTVIGTRGMARLYRESDINEPFRVNGLPTPTDQRYEDAIRDGYRGYRLPVDGLVERPHTFTLDAAADADHAARLRGGLERRRQVDGRAARDRRRDGATEADGALRRLPLLRQRR